MGYPRIDWSYLSTNQAKREKEYHPKLRIFLIKWSPTLYWLYNLACDKKKERWASCSNRVTLFSPSHSVEGHTQTNTHEKKKTRTRNMCRLICGGRGGKHRREHDCYVRYVFVCAVHVHQTISADAGTQARARKWRPGRAVQPS